MEWPSQFSIVSGLISVSAIILLVLHLLYPSLAIDAITITLLLIAIVPWVGQIIESIKLPGGIQIDYRKLEEISRRLDESGLAIDPPQEAPEYVQNTIQALPPNLQLVNLRIEIEKRLRHLAQLHDLDLARQPLVRVTENLIRVGELSRGEYENIRQLLNILNPVVHGEEIHPAVFAWAIEEGPRILAGLDRRIERIVQSGNEG